MIESIYFKMKFIFALMIRTIFILIILCFSGCVNDKPEKLPITEEKTIDVLTDLYLLQARAEYQLPFDSLNTLNKQHIFMHHQITQSAFDSTLKLLIKYPAYFKNIQDSVDTRLQNLQKKRDELQQ